MTNPVPQNDSRASKVPGGRRLLVIGVAALVAVGLAIPAAIFGPQLVGLGQPANEAPSNPAPAAASPDPAALTEFRNEQVGFALSYPSSWVQRQANDPQILLSASDASEKSAFLVRAVELPQTVGQQELEAAKELTDRIVGANPSAKLLFEPRALELAGLPGYWYFYSFKDDTSGQQGAHSHYFLFKGKTMLSFVFQTIPLEEFSKSAADFDQITSSLRTL
ncbi:MAG: hypothetical protein ACRDTG_31955 [Pseudonocardiaceae bacterium]